MSKNRMVNTRFWNDNYSSNLDPIEKLLFLYLLTNEHTTLAGIYELPRKVMAVETGIETDMVAKILGRFEGEGKIKAQDGWIAIKNFSKHHETGSPTVKKGIEEAIKEAPAWARDFIESKGIDTLSPSASASALSFTSIAEVRTSDELIIVKDLPDLEGKQTKFSRKTTPEMKAVFEVFDDNPDRKTWHLRELERSAAAVLFTEFGISVLKARYASVKKYRREPLCPAISRPSEFLEKMPNMVRFISNL